MRFNSIPLSLLKDNAILRKVSDYDIFGKANFTEIALQNIRFITIQMTSKNKDRIEQKSTAKMYFDCENSSPKNTIFSPLDYIFYHNCLYSVQKIEEVKGEKPHHYKLFLKKEE